MKLCETKYTSQSLMQLHNTKWARTTTNTSSYSELQCPVAEFERITIDTIPSMHTISFVCVSKQPCCSWLIVCTQYSCSPPNSQSTQNIHRSSNMQYMKTARIYFHLLTQLPDLAFSLHKLCFKNIQNTFRETLVCGDALELLQLWANHLHLSWSFLF